MLSHSQNNGLHIFTIYRRTMITQKTPNNLSPMQRKFPSRGNSFSKTLRGFPIKPTRLSVQVIRNQLSPSHSLHFHPQKPPQQVPTSHPNNTNLNLNFKIQFSRQVSPRVRDLSQVITHSLSCKNLDKRLVRPSVNQGKTPSINETIKEKKWFTAKTPKKTEENTLKQNVHPYLSQSTKCNFFKQRESKQHSFDGNPNRSVLASSKSDHKILTFSKKTFENIGRHPPHNLQETSPHTPVNHIKKCLNTFNAGRKELPAPLLAKTESDTEPKPEKLNFSYPSRNSCKQFLNRSNKTSENTSTLCSFVKKESPNCQVLNLNEFAIGECKGEGRYGKVYHAVHKKTGWTLAIKKIRKETIRPIAAQFINEMKLQYSLSHPNIIQLFGYFDDEDNIYLLLQYMEEGSLYRYIKNKEKLEEDETVQKLGEICEAVSYMHRNDILHRDLKPENVVMSHGVCKICDFGWSVCSKTKRKTCCGTLDYTCPQVAAGSSYTKQIDVWAIGVLTFQMLTGKPPFYHFSRQQTMTYIRNCSFQIPSYISQKAKAFIEKILSKSEQDHSVKIDELLSDVFLQNIDKSCIL